jgi:hypothetical protein
VSEALSAAGKHTWDHIVAAKQRCGCMACNRFGLPFVVTKAVSVQNLQRATTIGNSKAIKRCFLHWPQATESLWAEIFCVATSRVMKNSNRALDFNITTVDVDKSKRAKSDYGKTLRPAASLTSHTTSDSK